jgi:hypothetical protein
LWRELDGHPRARADAQLAQQVQQRGAPREREHDEEADLELEAVLVHGGQS